MSEVPLSWFYGMFDSSDVDLHTAAGDSVYSAEFFRIPLILCGIVFFIFLVGLYVVLMSCFLRILPMQSVTPWIYIRKALFVSVFMSVGCFCFGC